MTRGSTPQSMRSGRSDVAVYCYTSGTTGRPKAAMLSHGFILDNGYRLMGSLRVEPGARYLSYISPAWAAEQYLCFGLALLAPLMVHFAEKPETVQSDMREVGPEFLMFTPRQWEMLASGVEAQMMMDAGPWRRRLYRWGTRIGRARNVSSAGAFTRYLAAPLADLLVLRGVRNFLRPLLGARGAERWLRIVGRTVHPLSCLRHSLGQSLRLDRAWPRLDPSPRRCRSRHHGPANALGSDHRGADGSVG